LSEAGQVGILVPDMSEFSAAEIQHLAKLARISLSDTEVAEFSAELPKILEFVEQLKAVKLADDLPAEALTTLEDLRADEVSGQRLSAKQLAALAPDWQAGQNVVPAVFGEVTDEG
jgi:aspartyl-tRNA(Asn)/glutamyl-tRNA(Gln) amidotransferase subunit C